MSNEKNGGFGSFFCFLTGAIFGAGLGLLFAPSSGKETSDKIKNMSDKLSEDVKEKSEKISAEAQKALEVIKATSEKAVTQIKGVFDSAKSGYEKLKKKESPKKVKSPVAKAKAGE